jgi:MoaA/NifB/PqqE/SkfB family radical SAM enzyme
MSSVGPILSEDEAFAPHVPPITLELTSSCNLICPYCANPTLKRGYGDMDDAMLDRLIGECADNGYQVMAVHGIGEPLLRKDLDAILARMSAAGVWRGWISTNGVLLTPARTGRLVASGLTGTYVSLDTLDAELYRRTRGGKLAKVIDNLKATAQAFPQLAIVVGLMRHKEQALGEAALDLFYDLFAAYPNIHHHAYENMRFPQAAEDWRRVDPATGERFAFDTCDQWSHHFTIAIDGRVSICCVDQEVDHPIGDVRTAPIREIWLSQKAQAAFRSILLGLDDCPSVCTSCVLKPSGRRLADVDPLLAAPYREVERAAQERLAAGRDAEALALLKQLKGRNPWDAALTARIAALEAPEPGLWELAAQARRARASA